ncbi:MAG: c-type cytochrome [Anaerolineales bacterium]|nr:c-type cytochrome [Anaerolineales bacterium]
MKKPWYNFLYVSSPLWKIGFGLLGVLLTFALLLFIGVLETPRMEAQTANFEGRSVQNGAMIFANNCSSCHGINGEGLPGVAPALNSRYFFEQRIKDLQFTGSLKDYVKLTVAAGRPANKQSQWAQMMPTWSSRYGGPLRDDQVSDVSDFVLNWEADALQQTAETDPWQPFQNAPTTDIFTGQVVEQSAPAASAGPLPPQELYVTMGCVGCHNIDLPQDDQNKGPIAPNLGNLAERAGSTVAGEDAVTYVHNSIVNPSAYSVPNYNPVMPANFTERMSEEEINSLVAWLLDPNRQK